MSQVPKPRKVIASVEACRQSNFNNVESWKSLYNAVVDLMGPDCPHEPFREDASLLNSIEQGAQPSSVRDFGVQTVEDSNDDRPIKIIPEPGGSGNMTISLDSSSEDDSYVKDIDSKENVLLESLTMKSLIASMKQEKAEDQKSLLHYIVMENLPPKVTDSDLERDVFSLVEVDRKSLALNIQRNKTESAVQIYTNDMRQVQKILACDKKVVVGGRVLATRIGTAGRI